MNKPQRRQQSPPFSAPSKKKRKDNWPWLSTAIIVAWFFGLISLGYVGASTVASRTFLARALIACCLSGLILPFWWYHHKLGLGMWEALILNIMGIGPFVFGSLLWVNFLWSSGEQIKSYTVEKYQLTVEEIPHRAVVVFTLENNAFEENEEFRRFELGEVESNALEARKIEYTIADGILGYPVVKNINFRY